MSTNASASLLAIVRQFLQLSGGSTAALSRAAACGQRTAGGCGYLTAAATTMRRLHTSRLACHGNNAAQASGETITVTFIDEKDGSETTVQAPVGNNMMEVAHANDVDLEGACEGSLACSTCHVIVEDPVFYDRLPEPDDDENDMLDLAFGLTDTSRLGCQVKATQDLDGMRMRIPSATRNFAVDGHVPKPH